jgi:hypothetical protein
MTAVGEIEWADPEIAALRFDNAWNPAEFSIANGLALGFVALR